MDWGVSNGLFGIVPNPNQLERSTKTREVVGI